jgi:hypothetical protein
MHRSPSTDRRALGKGLLAFVIVTTALAAVLAPTGSAAPNATLTVQLVPGAVSAGQPALAVATFHNVGPVTLSDVRINLHFPSGLSVVSAPGCTSVGGSSTNYVCDLGDVRAGAFARANVSARVTPNLAQSRNVRVGFALRVGPGTPLPVITGASAKVLASSTVDKVGSCLEVPKTLTATLDQQETSLPAPPIIDPKLNLPCTPLAVGVSPTPPHRGFKTKLASVDVPKLSHPARVVLKFPNETLPDEGLIVLPPGVHPSFDNPNPLWRLDDNGKRFVVPRCKPGPAFPPGWHSCVISVVADPKDPAHDYDSGTVTLLVQGSGFGDPHYIG